MGASNSSRMGWLMKISRAFVHRYFISYSWSWTGFPGRLPRTGRGCHVNTTISEQHTAKRVWTEKRREASIPLFHGLWRWIEDLWWSVERTQPRRESGTASGCTFWQAASGLQSAVPARSTPYSFQDFHTERIGHASSPSNKRSITESRSISVVESAMTNAAS